jgi:hypothetical protein
MESGKALQGGNLPPCAKVSANPVFMVSDNCSKSLK